MNEIIDRTDQEYYERGVVYKALLSLYYNTTSESDRIVLRKHMEYYYDHPRYPKGDN